MKIFRRKKKENRLNPHLKLFGGSNFCVMRDGSIAIATTIPISVCESFLIPNQTVCIAKINSELIFRYVHMKIEQSAILEEICGW